MRPNPKAAFILGLAALLLLLGLGIGYAVDPGLFSRRVLWIARFPSTATLDEGAPVYAHGAVVGRVASLAWRPAQQDYEVRLRLDPEWQPPAEGGVRVEEVNPLRGPVVQVVEGAGCEDRRLAAAPRELPTCRRSAGLAEVAHDILGRVAEVTVQVQALAGRIGIAGADAAAPSPFAGVADNLGALSASARVLVERLVGLEPELRETLLSAKGASAGADATMRRTQALLDGVQRDTVARLDRTLDGADRLLRTAGPPLQSSAADLRYIMGASSTSLVQLIAELQTTAANLAELTRELRDSPGVLLRGRTLQDPPGTPRGR